MASLTFVVSLLAATSLTSALPSAKPATSSSIIKARFDDRCSAEEVLYTPAGSIDQVISCYEEILALGTDTSCGSPGPRVTLCERDSVSITASGVNGEAISHCSDVARGMQFVLDSCVRSDGSVSGFAAAAGNGNLIIGITAKVF